MLHNTVVYMNNFVLRLATFTFLFTRPISCGRQALIKTQPVVFPQAFVCFPVTSGLGETAGAVCQGCNHRAWLCLVSEHL